jgi:hypothetical protein
MGLRHLVVGIFKTCTFSLKFVVSEDNRVIGMITRKDLAYLDEKSLSHFAPPLSLRKSMASDEY